MERLAGGQRGEGWNSDLLLDNILYNIEIVQPGQFSTHKDD